MATKINKKFTLVVTGFAIASAALLTGVIIVYQVYVRNVDRHVTAGDALMAEGKAREAYVKYGAAVSRKPDELKYLEKMEGALEKAVANTATLANEDYLMWLQLRNQRTRAQPGDPAQWKMLLEAYEDEANTKSARFFWNRIVEKAKEMKESVPPGTPGLEIADIYTAIARSHMDDTLTTQERADLIKLLQDLSTRAPKEWRVWQSLIQLQLADAERAARSGQTTEATQRMLQTDATIKAADQALQGAGPDAAACLSRIHLVRLLSETSTGRRIALNKADPLALAKALDEVYAAGTAAGVSGEAVRDAAAMLGATNERKRAMQLLDEWIAKHPSDLRTRTTAVILRGMLAMNDPAELDALRAAAKGVVDQPQLPTSLDASLQEMYRSNALSTLMNAELERIDKLPAAERGPVLEEIAKLRTQLLAAAQNQDTNSAVLAADAKIAQVKGDFPEAQRKWDAYFAKTSAPSADAFAGAIATAIARKEYGLAAQRAKEGSEAFPSDLKLVSARADVAMTLGRYEEALGILVQLRESFPDNEQINRLINELTNQLKIKQGDSSGTTDLAEIQKAVDEKRYDDARKIVDKVEKERGAAPQLEFLRARIAQSEGNMELVDQIVEAGLKKHPESADLWRVKAERATTDQIERIEMMVNGVFASDQGKRVANMLNAFRALKSELVRREANLRGPDPQEADKVKAQLAKLDAKIVEAEKAGMATASQDPMVIENSFAEALTGYEAALAENRQNDAQQLGDKLGQLLTASKQVPGAPELPIVLESLLLEAQGKIPEALAMVEKARAEGRTEARLSMRLAMLRERLGNEAGALEAWEESFRRRPNDAITVLRYARALGRAGKGAQGVEMMRDAAASNPSDQRLALALAQLETVYGSRARAIEVREDLARKLQPIDENLIGLYTLLYMPPSFDSLKTADGKQMSAAQWTGLTVEQRGRLLSDQARAYQERAERIYAEALDANPLDIAFAVQKARVMREQGTPDMGTAAIQAVIDAAKAKGAVPPAMYLDLGLHLLAANRNEAADKAFEEARKSQDPVKREADYTLVEIEVQRGRLKEAIGLMDAYAATNPRPEVQLRLAQLCVGNGEFDRAQAALDKSKAMAGANVSKAMQAQFELLAASILVGRGDAADRQGQLEKGKEFREAALLALSRASALQPDVLTGAIRRVGVLRTQAKSGGSLDQAFYDQAVAEADRLLARNQASYDAAALRAGLALDKGDRQGAINVLDRFIVALPIHDGARSRLIQLYLQTGNVSKAITLTRAAVDLAPTRADWRERLGDLLSISGDHEGAGDAYERAFVVQPEVTNLLAKAMDERTLSNKPEVAQRLAQTAPPAAQVIPAVRAAQAVALHKLNRNSEATAVAREAITTARAAGINSPAMQQVLPRLRTMYEPAKTQELVDLIVSTGAPSTAEKVLIASMWAELGIEHFDQVEKWSEMAIADGEGSPAELRAMAHTARGNARYARKELQGAISDFMTAAKLSPTNATALNNAAYLSAEADVDLEVCRDHAEAAVALAPEVPEFLDTLGYVLMKLGVKNNDPKLLTYAEGVLLRAQGMGESASILLHLGMTQAANSRTAEARRTYERAKKIASEAKQVDSDMIKKIDKAISELKP